MLTKKEKLLSQPWIVQKYQSHRRKTQKEWERLNEIQRENRRLLQRLGQIMSTRRLENFGQYSRPNFLNRERLYATKKRPKTSSPVSVKEIEHSTNDATTTMNERTTALRGQSARCLVCSGRYVKKNQVIPEERIPWGAPKISWNKKLNERMLLRRFANSFIHSHTHLPQVH